MFQNWLNSINKTEKPFSIQGCTILTTLHSLLKGGRRYRGSWGTPVSSIVMVFCCIVAWIQPYISGCQQDFLENILGYIREQFYRFSRGCKPRENLWNCSRKYTKMFKTDSFLGNKKLSLNQNVWRDHATVQQDVLLHFWVIFLHWNQDEIWKQCCLSALELFCCLPPLFCFLPLWKKVSLHGKKLQNATKFIGVLIKQEQTAMPPVKPFSLICLYLTLDSPWIVK